MFYNFFYIMVTKKIKILLNGDFGRCFKRMLKMSLKKYVIHAISESCAISA